jgi:hypothetical protein
VRHAAPERHASNTLRTLAIGVLRDTILVSQAGALDGAFGRQPRRPLVSAVEDMCVGMIRSLSSSSAGDHSVRLWGMRRGEPLRAGRVRQTVIDWRECYWCPDRWRG